MKNTAEDLNNQLETQLTSIGEQLQEGLENGQRSLAEIQEMVAAKTKEAAEAADQYVRKNPWSSLAIAAGLGVVAGLLLRRR